MSSRNAIFHNSQCPQFLLPEGGTFVKANAHNRISFPAFLRRRRRPLILIPLLFSVPLRTFHFEFRGYCKSRAKCWRERRGKSEEMAKWRCTFARQHKLFTQGENRDFQRGQQQQTTQSSLARIIFAFCAILTNDTDEEGSFKCLSPYEDEPKSMSKPATHNGRLRLKRGNASPLQNWILPLPPILCPPPPND